MTVTLRWSIKPFLEAIVRSSSVRRLPRMRCASSLCRVVPVDLFVSKWKLLAAKRALMCQGLMLATWQRREAKGFIWAFCSFCSSSLFLSSPAQCDQPAVPTSSAARSNTSWMLLWSNCGSAAPAAWTQGTSQTTDNDESNESTDGSNGRYSPFGREEGTCRC